MLEVGGRNIVRYNVNESIDSILPLLSSVLHFWVVLMVPFVVWCFWRFGRKYMLETYTHLYLCDNIICHEMKEASQNCSFVLDNHIMKLFNKLQHYNPFNKLVTFWLMD
jgi:hypothetical protein